MQKTTLTALYDPREEAERAVARLTSEAGVIQPDVNVIAQSSTTTTTGTSDNIGFFTSLKSMFVPDEDHNAYSEAIRRGGLLLTARVDEAHAERAMDTLEEDGAVDLDARQETWRASGWTEGSTRGEGQTMLDETRLTCAAPIGTAAMGAAVSSGAMSGSTGGEEKITLAEERLRVGKRATEHGRVRVRSYVVETPVEEQVTLRDENVHVERRVVDRAVTAGDYMLFEERVIEAIETDEEAVVSKTAHVTGEVVVSKTAEERVETVRDTVRRTEVEVEVEVEEDRGKQNDMGHAIGSRDNSRS